jgi:hypothetical protein
MGDRVLFQCAGPADGPPDIGSSTRCELSGYASALPFLDLLAQFWVRRHRCRFTWYCDNKAAQSRVRRFALRSSYRRRMPPDADLPSAILSHSLSIKCRIRHGWVKGHQDAGSSLPLSRAAKLNVQADRLATEYRTLGSLKSSPHFSLPLPMLSYRYRDAVSSSPLRVQLSTSCTPVSTQIGYLYVGCTSGAILDLGWPLSLVDKRRRCSLPTAI